MKTQYLLWAAAAATFVGIQACAATGGGSASNADAVASQIERGKALYVQHCASCHGSGGEGTKSGPAVVGKGALPLKPPPSRRFRKSNFRTAHDIAAFVVANMPPDGTKLTGDEYYAILGFDLFANGVKLSEPVGPNNDQSIVVNK